MTRSAVLLRRGALAAAILLVPAVAAWAGAPRHVAWRLASLGCFGHNAVRGEWIQRVVEVENTTDTDREVKVSCIFDLASGGQERFARVISLPAHSIRRFELAVRPGEMIRMPTAGRGQTEAHEQCEERYAVEDARTGEPLMKDFGLTDLIPSRKVRVGIIHGASEDLALYMDRLQGTPLGDVRTVGSFAYATRWYGYCLADVLVLIDPDMARMRASQREAVMDWVRRGGVLVLAGTNVQTGTFQQELADAAGVTAVGVHYETRLRVSGPGVSGAPVKLHGPVPMVELLPAGATVLYWCNGLPLLTQQRLGDGTVLTLATPLSAIQDPSLHEIWGAVRKVMSSRTPVHSDGFLKPDSVRAEMDGFVRKMTGRLGGLPSAERAKAESLLEALKGYSEPGTQALLNLAGRRAPPRWVPTAILLGLTALVVVGGILLRRRRRGERLWLVLVPVAVALAAVLYAVGLARTDPERLTFVGLVSGLGDGTARVQEAYAYYSGPQTRTLTFSAGVPGGIVRDLGQLAAAANLETRIGAAMTLPNQSVQTNATKAFYVDGVCRGLNFDPVFTFDGEGLTGTVENGLGFPLTDSVIYVGGRTYRLGNVAPGKGKAVVKRAQFSGRVEMVDLPESLRAIQKSMGGPEVQPPDAWAMRGQFTASDTFTVVDRLRNGLMGYLASVPRLPRQVRDFPPVLVGYGSGSVLDPLEGRVLDRQGWNVVTWPVRLEAPAPGTAVSIPTGFTRVEYGPRGLARMDYGPKDANTYDPVIRLPEMRGEMAQVIRAEAPAAVSGIENVKAKLVLYANAKSYRMTVSGLTGGGPREQEVASVERPSGVVPVDVPQADAFRGPGGAYYFLVRFKAMGTVSEESSVVNTFEGAEVDLEGTTR